MREIGRLGTMRGVGRPWWRNFPPTPAITATITGLTDNPTHGLTAQHNVALTAVLNGATAISYEWRTVAGGAIPGATAAQFVPVIGAGVNNLDDVFCRIGDGTSTYDSPAYKVRYAPPQVIGGLADQSLQRDTGIQTLDAAAAFSGSDLSFAINSLSGVSINAATGLISFDTETLALQASTAMTATVSNSGGPIEAAFLLTLAEVPSQMAAPVLTPASTSISVDRAAAPADNNAPITRYDLRWRVGAGGWTIVTGISDPEVIPGLASSTGHGVQTRAVNAVGAGPWSLEATTTTLASQAGADVDTAFGRLTLAGAGGIAVTGDAISSGDPGNHFQIVANVLSPSSAGVTAGLPDNLYQLILDDGQSVDLTITADEYSAISASEMNAAITDIGSAGGKTVRARAPGFDAGNGSTRFASGLTFAAPLIITGEPGAVISNSFWLQQASNVIFDGLTFEHTTGAFEGALQFYLGCDSVTVQDCTFVCGAIDHQADYETAPPVTGSGIWMNGGSGSSNITIRRAKFDSFQRGVYGLVSGAFTLEDCEFTDFILDPVELSFTGNGLTAPKRFYRNVVKGAVGIPANYPTTGAGDDYDPHSDCFSFTNVPGTGQRILSNVEFVQNVMFQRRGDRGRGTQGITTFRTGSDYMVLKDPLIAGNVMHGKDASHGITIPDIDGGIIVNNTFTQDPADPGSLFSAPIAIGGSSKAGTILVQGNIADAFSLGAGTGAGTIVNRNNVVLGKKGATLAYNTVFNSADFTPDDYADVLAQLTMRANGPADIDASGGPSLFDAGAIGSGYATFGAVRNPAGWSTDSAYEVDSSPASAPAATFIGAANYDAFGASHPIVLPPTLAGGEYIIFVLVDSATVRFSAVTLEGVAASSLGGNAPANSHYVEAFTATIPGGGDRTVQVTTDANTRDIVAIVYRVDAGTIDGAVVGAGVSTSPPDLDFVFSNSADEVMLLAYNLNPIVTFDSFDGGLTQDAAPLLSSAGYFYYGAGSLAASGGTPDTIGVNFTSGFSEAGGLAVRIT